MREQVAGAILIAVRDEFERLKKRFALQPESQTDGPAYHAFSFVDSTGADRKVVVRYFKSMGPSDARVATMQLLERYSPTLVVSCGVSGALQNWIRLGDLVIATASDDYEHRGKAVPTADAAEYTTQFGGRQFPTAAAPTRALAELQESRPAIFDRWQHGCLSAFPVTVNHQALLAKELVSKAPRVHPPGPVACGNTVGAAPAFKDRLKRHNRNYLAIDMESAGVLQACHENSVDGIVVRAISDMADDQKDRLEDDTAYDVRFWASENLFRFLDLALRHALTFSAEALGEPSLERNSFRERVHALVLRQLDPIYRDVDLSWLERCETLFSRLVGCAGGGDELSAGGVLAATARFVSSSQRQFPLRVEGPPGSGKSSFLACLYWRLRLDAALNGACLPVYLNIRHYDELDAGAGLLQDDLSVVIRASESTGLPVIFIVDGVEEYSRPSAELEHSLIDSIRSVRGTLVVSVALNFHYEKAFQRDDLVAYENADRAMTLGAVRLDDPAFEDYLASFVAVLPPATTAKPNELAAIVRKFELDAADLRTLSMIALHMRQFDLHRMRNVTEFYRNYCERWLGREVADVAALAFRYSLERDPDAGTKLRDDRQAWRLLHSHATIRDFLVAEHAIHLLVEAAKSSNESTLDRLSYIFPSQIARFAKSIANEKQSVQAAVLTVALKAMTTGRTKALVWLGYLAGRIKAPGIKPRAIRLLQDIKMWAVGALTGAQADARPELLLVARTAYISLMTLGRDESETEYIERMYQDRSWEAMNRAFYLEYYNDVDYAPGLELAHEDALQDFPNTYRVLLSHITQSIKVGKKYVGRDIQLYTLLSLAQHRQQAGKLPERYRTDILSLIGAITAKAAVAPRSETLEQYVEMMRRTLAEPRYRIGRVAEEFLQIKFQERRGWIKRTLKDRIESVADHSYGAWLLGYIYLPEAAPDIARYDKREILDMLLVHDLAEAYIGDLLPEERDQNKRREEKMTYGYIGALGTYSGIGNLDRARTLWLDFENIQSDNARIARDLDRLECLTQLYIYKKRTQTLLDAEQFETDLIADIKHPLTAKILEIIQEHFIGTDD